MRSPVLSLLCALLVTAAPPLAAQSGGAGAPAAAPGSGPTPTPTRRITTDHLQIATFATHDAVTPGTPFSLVFDIRPRDRMHVYAPGATNYRIIALTLEPNPIFETRPLQYPASEIYHFEPLNERIPVFQKPFRLSQTLAVSAAADRRQTVEASGTVTVKGTLDYQACDDRICFAPKSVPVSYTIALRRPAAAR